MKDTEQLYSNSRIDRASKVISKSTIGSKEYQDFLPIVEYWRAAHQYPLEVIASNINSIIKNQDDIIFVRRIKRLESIVGKLKRENNSGLRRMQDLGGCRLVVNTVDDVYRIAKEIECGLSNFGHIVSRNRIKDYIQEPRNTGYRSYHMVVEFKDTDCNTIYNGMSIEIQIRTRLQHYWATAVEILDAVTKGTLKAGIGDPDYLQYFKLISALFSMDEGTPLVNNITIPKEIIVNQIRSLDAKKRIREKLSAYNNAIKLTKKSPVENAEYFLLITNFENHTITVRPFSGQDYNTMTKIYNMVEANKISSNIDVVLVAAKSFDNIIEGYPNYFSETLSFLNKISLICSEFPEKSLLSISEIKSAIKIADKFNLNHYSANNPYVRDEGIGRPSSNIIVCPSSFEIRLQSSYLRYSAITVNDDKEAENICQEVVGPAILVNHNGASFFIDSGKHRIVSSSDYSIIKDNSNNLDNLLYLLAWLKSNVFLWDLIWNKNNTEFTSATIFPNLTMPNLDQASYLEIQKLIKQIIGEEKSFVSDYNNSVRNEIDDNIKIARFNDTILEPIRKIEMLFYSIYNIDEEKVKILKDEILRKGYYFC